MDTVLQTAMSKTTATSMDIMSAILAEATSSVHLTRPNELQQQWFEKSNGQ